MGGPPALEFSPVEGGSVSEQIPAGAGGTVIADLMRLEVPADALLEDMTVTMTVLRDTSRAGYTLLGMFEPDGLVLSKPATLVITLDPPLPPGMSLNLLVVDSLDPDALVDTGLIADVSEDGSKVSIDIEHFSCAGSILNCHGHSVRNIIKGLLARGMTKDEILQKIRDTVGNQLAVKNQSVDDAYKKLEENYDKLSDFKLCAAGPRQLLAYLNTFYTLATVRLNAEYSGLDNATLDAASKDCLDNLSDLTKSSDMPPILNFGRQFTLNGGQSDSGVSSETALVFFDSVPHSAPLIERGSGNVVIENGTVMSNRVAVALQVGRNNNPSGSAEETPRVVAVKLSDLDRFRAMLSGEGLKEELRRWGADETLVSGAKTIP